MSKEKCIHDRADDPGWPVEAGVVRRASPAPDALREALEWFCDQAECWLESRVPEARPGWVKPAIDKGRAALRSGDGWTRVEFREGFDGEWTCSGCGRDWVCEAENPEANGYKFCPGCGGWIIYVPLPPAPEDR